MIGRALIMGGAFAALLASPAAHANLVQAPPPTGGSGGIACAVGPNYQGSIPEPAAAMGYTTCVANYDFTNTLTFTNGGPAGTGNYNFSNISSWLACTDNQQTGPLWYYSYAGTEPCPATFNMINDGGKQTLDITYTPSDWFSGAQPISLATASGHWTPPGMPPGLFFGAGFYGEVVQRYTPATFSNINVDDSTNLAGTWSDTWNNNLTISGIEWDWNETFAGSQQNYAGSNSFEHCAKNFNCGGAGGESVNNSIPGWSTAYASAYHTYADLTFVNSSGYGACSYVDGMPLTSGGSVSGCTQSTYADPTSENGREQGIIWFGAGTPGQQCGSQSGDACYQPSGNLDYLIQRITIFSCSTWATGPCPQSGALPTSPP